MILLKQLEQLGLSAKEAKVYISLLEVGEATPQELATSSGTNRATTYVILENLGKQDLVKSFTKKKKLYFALENPLQILEMLYLTQKQVHDKIEVAKRIMPELEMLARLTSERAKVKFFEGREGIIMIQKDIINSKAKNLLSIWNINLVDKNFPAGPNDHRQEIIKRNIKDRGLVIYDPAVPIPKMPLTKGEERRYLPLSKFNFHADFVIYKNKVALVATKKQLLGVIIENQDIADGLKSLFELAWHGASQYTSVK